MTFKLEYDLTKKLDPFKYWFLPKPCRDLLDKYQSPTVECSLAKQIPISGNEILIEKLVKNLKLKRRFRGPRTQRTFTRDCIKKDAERVTLYAR